MVLNHYSLTIYLKAFFAKKSNNKVILKEIPYKYKDLLTNLMWPILMVTTCL